MIGDKVPFPHLHQSMAPGTNRGDGIALGLAAGGRLEDMNRDNAFWTPVSMMRNRDGSLLKCPHLITDRSKPGLIAVNQQGRQIGRAHVGTPVTNSPLVCRLLLE